MHVRDSESPPLSVKPSALRRSTPQRVTNERVVQRYCCSALSTAAFTLRETGSVDSLTLSVTISAFFRIEFWPAWLSPRMRLSSPDHAPLIARTRVLAICSFCRFSSYSTASGRFYQPGETFMTHLTYS